MDWKPGDIVRLKSGGPMMTVDAVGEHMGSQAIWCTWFVGTKKFNDTFGPHSLKSAENERSGPLTF